MLRHVVLLVMFSGLLPKSLQVDELVLAHSKDGKRYIAKRGQTHNGIDEDVGTDYSRLKGDFIDRGFSHLCDQVEIRRNVLILTGFRENTRSFGLSLMAKGNGRIRATV